MYINTDGGSRGNPGPAGIGVAVFTEDNKEIHTINAFLGHKTNNEAEYQAVIESLKWLKKTDLHLIEVCWRLDSKLVVEQLSRRWKIKEFRLQELAQKCWMLLAEVKIKYSFNYIPRAENARADELANIAMDRGL